MTRRIKRVYLLIDDEGEVEQTCQCARYFGRGDCLATPLVFVRRSDARDYARDMNCDYPNMPRLRVVVFDRRES